ncbi:tyrosine-type recombinase/integrase [Azospirillum argentinense]
MDHVRRQPNGKLYVDIKVPSRLRSLVGKTNLRHSLDVTSLDASAKRAATAKIAEFQALIANAERRLTEQAAAHKRQEEKDEQSRYLEFFGIENHTELGELIDFGAANWPHPDTGDAVLAEITNRIRSSKQPEGEFGILERHAVTLSARLEYVRKIIDAAKKGENTHHSPRLTASLDKSLTVTGLLKKFNETTTPTPDNFRQYKTAVALFCESERDKSIHSIDRDTARRFRDYLHGRTDLAYGTCDQRMKKLSALFNFAHRENLTELANPFSGMELSKATKEGHGDEDPGKYLEPSVVNTYLTEILPQFGFDNSMRWPFLVMLHTGMRVEECCGLRVDEVVQQWGVDCFHIRPRKEDNRTIKSGKARFTPIHHHLWDALGFRAYVKDRRDSGKAMLFDFPQWRRQKYSAKFQEDMSKLRKPIEKARGINLGDQHDLRHTLVTLLREAGVSEEYRCLIVGHSPKSGVNAGYGDKDAVLDHLRSALHKMDLSRYDFSALRAHGTP